MPLRTVIVLIALLAPLSAAMADTVADFPLKTATGTLWGTLAIAPAAKTPAALILAGSGATDRDGNGPTIHPNSYRMLAEGLLARGVTTLRIDKRGVAASRPAAVPEDSLRVQAFADDAEAWAQALREKTGAPCVWLIGHSEGALIATVVANHDSAICGLVLISAPGRKLGDVLRQQLRANPDAPADLVTQSVGIVDSLEAGKTVPEPPPQLAALFRPSVQPYLISELALDPAQLLAATKVPVLVLQGDNDLQVSVEDAKRLAAARPDAKLVVLPGVNHVLKHAPTDRAGNIAAYGDPSLPLGDGVVSNVADFILGHTH